MIKLAVWNTLEATEFLKLRRSRCECDLKTVSLPWFGSITLAVS